MKSLSKKTVIVSAVSLIAVAGLLMGFMMSPGSSGGGETGVRLVTLEPTTLTASVSATGTVYSTDATNVYSSLSYRIKTVNVSVGDEVTAGQVLAQLDTTSLSSDIAQKRASIASAEATAQQNLKEAEENLETYKKNMGTDYDTELLSAQSAVTTAEIEVRAAQSSYQNARKQLNEAEDREYEMSDLSLLQYRATAVAAANTLEKAEENYEKAKKNLEAIKNNAGTTLQSYENKVASAQLNTDFTDQKLALAKLEQDLADCTVKAPVSGTVTAVSAVEGASGSGLLFVIQDTENLKITTYIKEYDIAEVALGDRVTIKSDATGTAVYEGTLSWIAPTSTLSANGDASSSTDAEYEAEVTVDSEEHGLLIGMNARLAIITDEVDNVYTVPYEAIGTGADGESYILTPVENEKGQKVATQVLVATGLENDLYTEISGEGLETGMQIVKNVSNTSAGDIIG